MTETTHFSRISARGIILMLLLATFASLLAAQNTSGESYQISIHDSFGKPVAGAEIDAAPCGLGVIRSDAGGNASFSLPVGANCYLSIRKPGLQTALVPIRPSDSHTLNIAMGNDRSGPFTGSVFAAGSGAPLPGATVYARSNSGNHVTRTLTDARGNYTLRLNPRQDYTVTFAQNGYQDQSLNLKTAQTLAGTESIAPVQLSPGVSDLMAWLVKNPSGVPRRVPVGPFLEGDQNGFGIQLASGKAAFTEPGNKFADLADYGKFYFKQENDLYKLRLGIFRTRDDAQAVVDDISVKFPGVFATAETGVSETMFIDYNPPASTPPADDPSAAAAPLNNPPADVPAATPPAPAVSDKRMKVYKTQSPAQPAAPVQYSTSALQAPGGSPVRYAVQVGSFTAEQSFNLGDYGSLADLGHLYVKPENGLQKVRVGIWADVEKAEAARAQVVTRGFRDATVTAEKAGDPDLQPYFLDGPASLQDAGAVAPAQYSSLSTPAEGPAYYVRIAALSNPERFDPAPYQTLGAIEMRPLSNGMTLILLGRYGTAEEALAVQKTLRQRGETVPYAVKDDKGKLERLSLD